MNQDPLSIVSRLRSAGCVFAEEEAELLVAAAASPVELSRMVERRVAGDPLEQILGWAEFCGLRIAVEPGVFVPRRRSELLVQQAAGLVGGGLVGGRLVVVDLCCGSGALGVALAATVGPVELYAADIDPAAVRCARRNVSPVGGEVFAGDLYAALPDLLRGRIDIVLANVPYVPTQAIAFMPPEARIHEPAVALDGGMDGLEVFRRVSAEARRWLSPGGSILVEASEAQVPTALMIFTADGLSARSVTSDELDATAVIGTLAE
jgi:release factor glutamine methyltransferase